VTKLCVVVVMLVRPQCAYIDRTSLSSAMPASTMRTFRDHGRRPECTV